MKTIVVPTDFSPAAINAMNYAVNMGLSISADILLLNVYQVPVAVTDAPLILVSVDELRDSAEGRLNDLKKAIEHVTSNKIRVYTEAKLGDVSNELEDLCDRIQPFAIVMGTMGHSSMERTLFGSTALSVIRHVNWPVITVPVGKEYGHGIIKVGLAVDFKESVDASPVSVIRTFIREFGSELHVLNVNGNTDATIDAPTQSVLLQTALEGINPEYHFINSKDVEDGINEFAEKNNLDLVITIPRKHKVLEGLFKKSSTRQLVMHSHVPIMCLGT